MKKFVLILASLICTIIIVAIAFASKMYFKPKTTIPTINNHKIKTFEIKLQDGALVFVFTTKKNMFTINPYLAQIKSESTSEFTLGNFHNMYDDKEEDVTIVGNLRSILGEVYSIDSLKRFFKEIIKSRDSVYELNYWMYIMSIGKWCRFQGYNEYSGEYTGLTIPDVDHWPIFDTLLLNSTEYPVTSEKFLTKV